MRYAFPLTLLMSLFLIAQHTAAAAGAVSVGFLEDICEIGGRDIAYTARIRMAFTHESTWKAFEHTVQNGSELRKAATTFSGAHSWHLTDHDSVRGAISSRGIGKYTRYHEVGTQELSAEVPGAVDAPRDFTYAGQPGCPVRTPRVATTAVPAKDAEAWDEVEPDRAPSQEMAAFIKKSTKDLYIDTDDRPVRAKITEKDLIMVERYRSPSKGELLALQFHPGSGVLNAASEPERLLYWFSLSPKGQLLFLGRGLVLIDWADYDGDGGTEFLFWMNGESMNGYLIAWDGCTKTDTFTWRYH